MTWRSVAARRIYRVKKEEIGDRLRTMCAREIVDLFPESEAEAESVVFN